MMDKEKILTTLFDMENIIEDLDVKSKEDRQWDLIQMIYAIISEIN